MSGSRITSRERRLRPPAIFGAPAHRDHSMIKRLLATLNTKGGRDTISTFAAEGLATLGMVLTYRLAAIAGSHELDLYVVVRRTVSFAYPLVLIGAVVGLTRFVALAQDEAGRRRFLRGAISWVLPFALLLWLLAVVFPSGTSWMIFGSEEGALLMPALGAMTFGLCMHAVSYSYLRGAGFIHAANVLQLITLALGPCVAFVMFTDLRTILWFTAVVWIAAPVLAMLPFLPGGKGASKERVELLRFGLPRVPGDLAFAALLTVPVYMAARTYGLDVAGQVGFGATLLNMVSALFSPVALMLLPTSAAQLARGDHHGLSQRIQRLSTAIIGLGVLITIGFELVSRPLLLLYLGETGEQHVFMCRLVFIAALPFAYFIGLRSVLDAYYHTPRNGINLIVAFLILLICGAIHFVFPTPPETMAVAMVIALFYLGWATYRDVQHVRSELGRLGSRTSDSLNLLVVIPAAEGKAYPFAYRQANALGERFGANITYFHLDSRTAPLKLIGHRRRFKKLLRKSRPDVVLAYYGSVSALFTVLSSAVPVVVYFQGSDLNKTPQDGKLRDFLGRLFSQLAAFFAAGIVCVSERLRDQLWWRVNEVKVFALGADLERFHPMDRAACREQLGWSLDEKIVLFNANHPVTKRLDIAIDVEQRLKARMPEARLETLVGGVPFDRMPVLLNAADALLLCSNTEGSPSMVKEGMVCNLPVVCNDVGDTVERLRDVHPGAVVAQEAGALTDALLSVLQRGERSNGRSLAPRNGCDARVIDADLMAYLRSMMIHA
jgi:teichuronic acid biosynthesis glycosyltransferase TuaC